MKKYFENCRKRLFVLASMSVFLQLSACTGVDEMRWKEQVWLNNGQFILIDRHATARKSGFPDTRRGPVVEQTIRYSPMGFDWSTKRPPEHPISFDIIDGSAYLVTIPTTDPKKFCIGKEAGSYVAMFYKFSGGEIREVRREDVPFEKLANNITGDSQWGYVKEQDRTYLSWSDVADSTAQPRAGPPKRLPAFFKKRSWLRCE
jgi:hypothetical protein